MKNVKKVGLQLILLIFLLLLNGCATVAPRLQESGLNSDFSLSHDTPFEVYVRTTLALIEKCRVDLNDMNKEKVMQANAPFELRPQETLFPKTKAGKYQKGVLLIHGLSDSPYLMQPIARHLQARGFLVRAILLPGHGTVPGDLLKVTYEAWIKAVAYGAATLRADAEQVYLGGFSTGGALSVLHALRDDDIKGLFLFAPALAVKDQRVALAGFLGALTDWIGPLRDDVDYVKYESFAANAAYQIYLLTEEVHAGLEARQKLNMPIFAALSEDDTTVDAARTLDVMRQYGTSKKNRIVLYTKDSKKPRGAIAGVVMQENSSLPGERILDFSHIAVTIPPDNPHYGVNGDYRSCLHYQAESEKRTLCLHSQDVWQGEITAENLKIGVVRRLSYNPLHGKMMEHLDRFLEEVSQRP